MGAEQDLIQKLMISKQIMDKHNGMNRNQMQGNVLSSPMVEEYSPVQANYNLPSDMLSESSATPTKVNTELPTSDRILNSRLPDEIKKLMMEHPIQQPNMGVSTGSVLSNELVEKASRLMNTNAKGDLIQQPRKPQQQINESIPNNNNLKSIIRETMEEVLKENGLLVESESKSNDLFKFRVGDHIFEGKIVRVKKVSK
jgi:hypothetical protein